MERAGVIESEVILSLGSYVGGCINVIQQQNFWTCAFVHVDIASCILLGMAFYCVLPKLLNYVFEITVNYI